MTGKILGSFGTAGSLTASAIGPLDGSTVFLLVAAVVFAVATWRSKAPSLLRDDVKELSQRLERTVGERAQLRTDLDHAREQIQEMKAKDTTALFDYMRQHDDWEKGVWAKLMPALEQIAGMASDHRALSEALKIVASGALAEVPVVRASS